MAQSAIEFLRIVPLPLCSLPSICIKCYLHFYFRSIQSQKPLINAFNYMLGRRKMDMSEDKEKIEALTKKVDDLILAVNGIVGELRQVSSSLKSLVASQLNQPQVTRPIAANPAPALSQGVAGAPQIHEKSKFIEDVKMMFPEDLEGMLSFEEKEEYVIVKPKQFLGSDNFSKIASIVRGEGGEYVSAGKASHFRIPKKRS